MKLNLRKLFRITKYGTGGGAYDGTAWWNWEKPVINPDDLLADPLAALGFSPIVRALQLVSNDLAKVPLRCERKVGNHYEPDDATYPELAEILNETTNSYYSAYEFKGWMARCMMLWGNSFALISRWGDDVRELIPVRPWDMTMLPDPEKGGWYYRSGEYGDIAPKDILHFRMPTYGRMLWGDSPVTLGRKAIALGMEQENAGRSAFAMPGLGKIAITTKETMGGEGVKKMQTSFINAHSGPEGMLRPIVVQNESDVKQVGQSLTDQDWIAARNFSIHQVSQLYGVPPQQLYSQEETHVSSAVSEASRLYVDSCLSQYTQAFANELAFKLLPSGLDGEKFRFNFDTTQLVRGNFNEQVAALQIAVQTGVMTRNEAREMMGYPPIEGGDEVLIGPNLLPPEMNREQAESGNQDDAGSSNGDE